MTNIVNLFLFQSEINNMSKQPAPPNPQGLLANPEFSNILKNSLFSQVSSWAGHLFKRVNFNYNHEQMILWLPSIIVELYLSLLSFFISKRERERADTIITLYQHTTPHHRKLFKDLRVDLYSSVIHHWNRQLKPYWFPLKKIGLIRVSCQC